MHQLDRPIWHALKTRQASFAVGDERALRFQSDVEPFGAARDESAASMAALGKLVPTEPESYLILLQADESPCPPGAKIELTATGVQMVLDKLVRPKGSARIEELTDADTPAMIELATLTKPGPFLARTHQLGTFWGVKENGRLIAMAGERMKLDGMTEVSGVCTHPDFRGRGLAALLSHHVATDILARGETPFLHAFADNHAAISVYEVLGFKLRRPVCVTVLRRAAP
jgi:ribosomal protein S18 acetylase RimI-like enzyme